MAQSATEAIVDELQRAASAALPIAPLSSRPGGLALDAAYRVQAAWSRRRVDAGATPVGWKVGLTSPPSQQLLGADRPMFGPLLDEDAIGPDRPCDPTRLIDPLIEAELAFRLGPEPPGPDCSPEEALAATEAVAAAFEIVDSRIERRGQGLADAVADRARASRFAIGSWVPREALGRVADASVEVARDGDEAVAGSAERVLGDPARSLAWLAAELPRHGLRPRPGDIVLSGSMIVPLPIAAGDRFEADFGAPLGRLRVQFNKKER